MIEEHCFGLKMMKNTFNEIINMRTLLKLILSISLLAIVSCEEQLPEPIAVTSVSLNAEAIEMTEGDQFELIATISPKNATNKTVIWSSSNLSIVSVADGKVIANKAGKAKIIVTSDDGGKTAYCEVTVNAKVYPVTSVSLDINSATLTEGDEFTLTATVNPDNATNKNVTWLSSNSSVASVSNGKVTALKAGKATITVKTEDGGKTATCEITVNAKVYPVTSVTLNKTSATLTEGDELTLIATVKPDNATNKSVTWTSSNSSVASVSNGKVTALKAGKATITVKTEDGGKTAQCEVCVLEPAKAESLSISYIDDIPRPSVGGCLFIGKYYDVSVTSIPANAITNYEWRVEDENIATISGNGEMAEIYTRNYGKTNVVVTDLISGVSQSLSIGTAISDFVFTEDTGETNKGYPMITLALGEKYQLNYSCQPTYATGIFKYLSSFNVREFDAGLNMYVGVTEPSAIDINENGLITAKKIGATILSRRGGGYITTKSLENESDGVFINVISEHLESEYNDDFAYADVIRPGQKIKFSISSSSDIDVFKFTAPIVWHPFNVVVTYKGDLAIPTGVDKHISYTMYNSDMEEFGVGNLTFDSKGSDYIQSRIIDTQQGYIRFYIDDHWKVYQTGIPTGYLTVEFVLQ